MGELGPVVTGGPYQGQDWDDHVVIAQAIAARTWGTYHCLNHPLPDGRVGVYDTSESTQQYPYSDQEFRPYYNGFPQNKKDNFIYQSNASKAVYMTWDGVAFDAPYNGVAIDAQYRSDVGNPSMTTAEQQTWAAYPYLKSVNNPFFTGYDPSNSVGWAQRPSQGWLNAGDMLESWGGLLHQYYTGVYFQNQDYGNFSQYLANNTNCNGLFYSGSTKSVNFDWGSGGPPGVNPDYFCAFWVTIPTFEWSGWYTFYVVADDGVRLDIDGTRILDKWFVQSPTLYTVSMYLPAGQHSIVMEYFENTGGAVARLSWDSGTGMKASYYDSVIDKNAPPTVPVVMVRPDIPVQYDWNSYSPLDTRQTGVPRIFEDTFSVRWEGYLYIGECRTYYFNARTDDGFILKITHADGNVETLIDAWRDQGPTSYFGSRYLCPGTYPLEARYYENGGWAVIWFSWN